MRGPTQDAVPDRPSRVSLLGLASTMGLHMVSGPIVGGALGYGLDYLAGSKPWGLCLGFGLGVLAGFRNVWADFKRMQRAEAELAEQAAKDSLAQEAEQGARPGAVVPKKESFAPGPDQDLEEAAWEQGALLQDPLFQGRALQKSGAAESLEQAKVGQGQTEEAGPELDSWGQPDPWLEKDPWKEADPWKEEPGWKAPVKSRQEQKAEAVRKSEPESREEQKEGPEN